MPTLDDVAWPRRTARLLIRRGTEVDAAIVWRYASHPAVTEWETNRDADEAAFTARWSDPDKLPVRLVVEHQGTVVGDLMLKVGDAIGQAEVADRLRGVEAEIGWSFDPAVHGQGYATESAEEMLAICFDELGLRRVVASCFADNTPSWRLMERLGMRRELASEEEGLHRTRGWLGGYQYALLATEWRDQRAGRAVAGEPAVPSLDDVTWPRRTERLLLRRPVDADLAACWRYCRLPEVTEWLTTAHPDEAAFAAWFDDPTCRARLVVVERDGVVVGHVVLDIVDALGQSEVRDRARGVEAELGWVLDPAVGGRGYATEAVRHLMAVAFEDLGLRRLFASCFADNTPSWRLMERVGMRRELASKEEAIHRTRGWLDGYLYALLATEWRTAASDPPLPGAGL